jgi:hypothetical protein
MQAAKSMAVRLTVEEKITKRLQLAGDADRHLAPGRIAVREGKDHQRPSVFRSNSGTDDVRMAT